MRVLVGTRVLKRRKVAFDLFDAGFLLGFAHGLIFLPWLRGWWRRGSGSPRRGVLGSGGIFADKHQKLMEYLIRKLVDVQFQFIFLNALCTRVISNSM